MSFPNQIQLRSFTPPPKLQQDTKYPHQQPIQFKQQPPLQNKNQQNYFQQNEQYGQSQQNNFIQQQINQFLNQNQQFRSTLCQQKGTQSQKPKIFKNIIQQNYGESLKQNISRNEFKKDETFTSSIQNNQGVLQKKIDYMKVQGPPTRAFPQNLNQQQEQQPQVEVKSFKQQNVNSQEFNQSDDRQRSISENIHLASKIQFKILAVTTYKPQNTEQNLLVKETQNQNQFEVFPQNQKFNYLQHQAINQNNQQNQIDTIISENDAQKKKMIKITEITNSKGIKEAFQQNQIDKTISEIDAQKKQMIKISEITNSKNSDASQNNLQLQKPSLLYPQNNKSNIQQQQKYIDVQQNSNFICNQQSNYNYVKPQSYFQQEFKKDNDLIARNESLTNNQLFNTVMSEQKLICLYCNNVIYGRTLQLSCFHTYCIGCFREQVKNVIEKKMNCLECLCKKKIKMTPLLDQQIYKEFKDSYFSNQLSVLYKTYPEKFQSCQKCNFFWIQNKFYRSSPLCANCS